LNLLGTLFRGGAKPATPTPDAAPLPSRAASVIPDGVSVNDFYGSRYQSRSVPYSNLVALSDALAGLKLFGMDVGKIPVNETTALGISTFYACLDAVTDALAYPPIGEYRAAQYGTEKLTDTPEHRVLSVRPNRHQTPFALRKAFWVNQFLFGEGLLRIGRDFYNQTETLTHIPRREYFILETTDGELFYQIAKTGERLREEDVIRCKGISINGKYSGGLLGYQTRTLQLGMGAAEFLNRYYQNGTMPPGYLKTDANVAQNKEAFQCLQEGWDEHRGLNGQSDKTPVLGLGTDYKSITASNKESQVIELLTMHPEEIYRMFRIQPSMVGDTSKATSFGSGVEQLGIQCVTYTLLPRATEFEQELNYKLLPTKYVGKRWFKHNFSAFQRGDFKTRMEAYHKGIQSGMYDPNTALALEEMNGYEGGDIHMVNGNMIAVKNVERNVPAGAPKQPTEKEDDEQA
jgi:HK97 family phage portal protein